MYQNLSLHALISFLLKKVAYDQQLEPPVIFILLGTIHVSAME